MTWEMNASKTETIMAASVVSLNMMKKMGAENTDPMAVNYVAKRTGKREDSCGMKHCLIEQSQEEEEGEMRR